MSVKSAFGAIQRIECGKTWTGIFAPAKCVNSPCKCRSTDGYQAYGAEQSRVQER